MKLLTTTTLLVFLHGFASDATPVNEEFQWPSIPYNLQRRSNRRLIEPNQYLSLPKPLLDIHVPTLSVELMLEDDVPEKDCKPTFWIKKSEEDQEMVPFKWHSLIHLVSVHRRIVFLLQYYHYVPEVFLLMPCRSYLNSLGSGTLREVKETLKRNEDNKVATNMAHFRDQGNLVGGAFDGLVGAIDDFATPFPFNADFEWPPKPYEHDSSSAQHVVLQPNQYLRLPRHVDNINSEAHDLGVELEVDEDDCTPTFWILRADGTMVPWPRRYMDQQLSIENRKIRFIQYFRPGAPASDDAYLLMPCASRLMMLASGTNTELKEMLKRRKDTSVDETEERIHLTDNFQWPIVVSMRYEQPYVHRRGMRAYVIEPNEYLRLPEVPGMPSNIEDDRRDMVFYVLLTANELRDCTPTFWILGVDGEMQPSTRHVLSVDGREIKFAQFHGEKNNDVYLFMPCQALVAAMWSGTVGHFRRSSIAQLLTV